MSKKRREPTPEQKAASEARRAKFRELSKQIAAMTPEQRAEMAARMPAIVSVTGRALSAFNSCLIVFQREGVTLVGGFRQWLAAGRSVRKGERGLSIWIPSGNKSEAAETTTAGGDPTEGDVEGGRKRFVCGYVFDVTQTQEGTANSDASEPADAQPVADVPMVPNPPPPPPVKPLALMPAVDRGDIPDDPVFDGWICTKDAPKPAQKAVTLELMLD